MSIQRFHDGDIEYYFERRRYGSSQHMRMYTWLMYRKSPGTAWQTYGDPWQKVKLNKHELAAALADIRSK